jgi:hypothetical protein
VITSLSVRINSLIGSKATSPFQNPDVIGCVGLADLAQANTFMQNGKLASNLPELPT